MKKKSILSTKEITLSSTAEYLTFISANGESGIELRYEDENIWMTQKMMAELYGVSVSAINQHIKSLISDHEINVSTIKKYLIVQKEGNREINRNVDHYNLQAIISVGFKIENDKAVQFRKWAREIVKEYTIKGFVMDDERLKNGGTILTKKFFEELLERIREIRISERKFYQKITDIYATAIDYDPTAKTTNDFFKKVQNKLHWAISGQTAPEVIYKRADAKKEYMGLTNWKDSPKGKIQRYDVVVAKNYLTKEELAGLRRIVSAYLDIAEDMAQRNIPMTMQDWAKRLDKFIEITDRDVLKDAGKISHEIAKQHAETEFEKYRIIQDKLFQSDFDKLIENTSHFVELNKKVKK
jgi:hypothetical protein